MTQRSYKDDKDKIIDDILNSSCRATIPSMADGISYAALSIFGSSSENISIPQSVDLESLPFLRTSLCLRNDVKLFLPMKRLEVTWIWRAIFPHSAYCSIRACEHFLRKEWNQTYPKSLARPLLRELRAWEPMPEDLSQWNAKNVEPFIPRRDILSQRLPAWRAPRTSDALKKPHVWVRSPL